MLRLQRKVTRLTEEISSLRESYAKKIARTELWAERMQSDKDDERERWYKEKEAEVERVKAAHKIMYNFLTVRNRRAHKQLEKEREDLRLLKEQQALVIEELKAEHQKALDQCAQELRDTKAAYEVSIERHVAAQEALDRETSELMKKLQQAEDVIDQKDEELKRNDLEICTLKSKLAANGGSREEERARWEAQVRALEDELRRVKKVMTKQRLDEARMLRKELMEYVKFIVHILPDNWQAYATQGLDSGEFVLSPELKRQLEEACVEQSGDGGEQRGYKLGAQLEEGLPPLSARRGPGEVAMTASGSGWRTSRPADGGAAPAAAGALAPSSPRGPHLKSLYGSPPRQQAAARRAAPA